MIDRCAFIAMAALGVFGSGLAVASAQLAIPSLLLPARTR